MNKSVLFLIFKRFLYSVFLLFLLVSFIFLLLHISPGDPVSRYISPELNPDLSERIRNSFGLNEPLLTQYGTFLSQMFTGNLGISFSYRLPVISVISEFLPFTIGFAIISFSIQLAAALGFSLMASKRKGSLTDKVTSYFNLFIYALPSFFTGVLLIFIFSEVFKIFPSSGLMSYNYEDLNFFGKAADIGKHMVLPLITLTLTGTAVLYRYLRENMDEAFNSEYVLYLTSNGIPQNKILREHILPNAISPLIAVAGIELGILLSGTLITEVIFGLPGMGRLTVQAILLRDYPLVTGCALISGGFIIASNFFADLMMVKIDKRLLIKGLLD